MKNIVCTYYTDRPSISKGWSNPSKKKKEEMHLAIFMLGDFRGLIILMVISDGNLKFCDTSINTRSEQKFRL